MINLLTSLPSTRRCLTHFTSSKYDGTVRQERKMSPARTLTPTLVCLSPSTPCPFLSEVSEKCGELGSIGKVFLKVDKPHFQDPLRPTFEECLFFSSFSSLPPVPFLPLEKKTPVCAHPFPTPLILPDDLLSNS